MIFVGFSKTYNTTATLFTTSLIPKFNKNVSRMPVNLIIFITSNYLRYVYNSNRDMSWVTRTFEVFYIYKYVLKFIADLLLYGLKNR